jgi:MFS family permease
MVEKYRNRRAISMYASAVSRMFLLLIALIPFLFSIETGLIFLIAMLLLHLSFSAIGGCSWNSWMRDLVPEDRLGSFFSKRMSLSMAISIPLSLGAGFYIDYWEKIFPEYELYSYAILFFFGFLAGMLGVYFISTIPEPRMAANGKTDFFKLIAKPFKDANFKNLIMFLGTWNFAINLAAPFFTVYMLKSLDLKMSLVIILMVLSQVINITFFRIWGRLSDRFSNKSVLGVSGPLFIACTLAWTFTTMPEKHILTIPLLIAIHIFTGISTAGVTLASGNIGLKLAPKGEATSYLAANSFVNSLAAGIAPVLGGLFADFFTKSELSLTLNWRSPGSDLAFRTLDFQQWDFFFFFAFLIGLYSIHRLAMVKEVGEVEERIVINELISEIRREMRNFSTVGGLRHMIQFPLSFIKPLNMRKK